MSDQEILNALKQISYAISNDVDKYKILNFISQMALRIGHKQDKAANYIDDLINNLK